MSDHNMNVVIAPEEDRTPGTQPAATSSKPRSGDEPAKEAAPSPPPAPAAADTTPVDAGASPAAAEEGPSTVAETATLESDAIGSSTGAAETDTDGPPPLESAAQGQNGAPLETIEKVTPEAGDAPQKQLGFASLSVHADDHISIHRAVAPPLHVSTTFRYSSDPEKLEPWVNIDVSLHIRHSAPISQTPSL